MLIQRKAWVCAIVSSTLVGAVTQSARAGFGDLPQTIFRNLNYALSPGFSSSPQGGPLFNFDSFSQRVEYDRVADGYSYEFYRFFGPDSFGEPNNLNLGAFQLQLGPDPALGQSQFTGIHGRAGFATRLIPEFNFVAETGQRSFNQFSGIATFNNEPLAYTARVNTGVQDMVWDGNIQLASSGRINALGFYDFDMRIINVGSFTADGVLLKDEQVTDFDTGQINLSGHIMMDALASLLQSNGNSLSAAPPAIFSAAAQKERTADELMEALQVGERLTDEELQFMMEQMFVKAFLSDPLGFIMNGPPTSLPGFDGVQLDLSPTASSTGFRPERATSQVPEPGTLVLFVLTSGAILLLRNRRVRAVDGKII